MTTERTAGLNTWVEIDGAALAQNIRFFTSVLGPSTELVAVIKANAYGHGLLEIAAIARECGVSSFAVHSLEEAQALRQDGAADTIILLGPSPPDRFDAVIRLGVEPVVSTVHGLKGLADACQAAGGRCRIHIKLETGTHRQGIDAERLDAFLSILKGSPCLEVAGACTHFANIEDTLNQEYAFTQLSRFEALTGRIEQAGIEIPKRHTACTAAVLLLKECRMDMVRLGIGLYGLWPSRETLISYILASRSSGSTHLKPVLTWKTRISEIKDVPPDSFVGYGCSFRTTHQSRIAILPVGYYDGYSRRLSNGSHVLVHGRRAPVRGRVCMNIIMIDVTDIPQARPYDEVVLLGRSGDEAISAEDLAGLERTINYEIVTRINPQIPRIIV